MLVDGVPDWPQDLMVLGTEGRGHFLVFPQGGDRIRLYLCYDFADKARHQVFLEPESLSTDVIYVNGVSTSLPAEVQEAFVHTVAGHSFRASRHDWLREGQWMPLPGGTLRGFVRRSAPEGHPHGRSSRTRWMDCGSPRGRRRQHVADDGGARPHPW